MKERIRKGEQTHHQLRRGLSSLSLPPFDRERQACDKRSKRTEHKNPQVQSSSYNKKFAGGKYVYISLFYHGSHERKFLLQSWNITKNQLIFRSRGRYTYSHSASTKIQSWLQSLLSFTSQSKGAEGVRDSNNKHSRRSWCFTPFWLLSIFDFNRFEYRNIFLYRPPPLVVKSYHCVDCNEVCAFDHLQHEIRLKVKETEVIHLWHKRLCPALSLTCIPSALNKTLFHFWTSVSFFLKLKQTQ